MSDSGHALPALAPRRRAGGDPPVPHAAARGAGAGPGSKIRLALGSPEWRTEVDHRIAVMKLVPQGGPASSLLVKRDLGDVLVSEWRSPRFEARLAPSQALSRDDSLRLCTVSAGAQVIEAETQRVTLRPGAMLLTTMRETGRLFTSAGIRKMSVKVPRNALLPLVAGAELPEMLILDAAASPLARLLTGTLAGIASAYEQMSALDLDVARSVVINLAAGMVVAARSGSNGADGLSELRLEAERWIVGQLSTGVPHVGDVARAFHVSPRTVQRAFAATNDTVRSVIRRHRIAEVKKDLLLTPLTLTAIAHKWGYSDASHLTREFKELTGETPGGFRRGAGR